MHCPICTQALEGGELVMVCTTCHKTLGAAGLDVGSTGEFRVPTPEMLVEAANAEPGEQPEAKESCSWCLKAESDVKKLIGRSGTALCNECVSLACDIMDAELGTGWR
ncbi:MAG TPA: ClpX C4-type zinc finger protein [Kofleriaceae bacterium]|nr:ClpX C4-type zinc finger protein [Kofleriaceae bacterium]